MKRSGPFADVDNSSEVRGGCIGIGDRDTLVGTVHALLALQLDSMSKMTQTIASGTALCGFAVAICAGLAASVDATQVLFRSALAMIFCYVVGWGVGVMCHRVIMTHLLAQNLPVSETVEATDRGGQASLGNTLVGANRAPSSVD